MFSNLEHKNKSDLLHMCETQDITVPKKITKSQVKLLLKKDIIKTQLTESLLRLSNLSVMNRLDTEDVDKYHESDVKKTSSDNT